MNLGISAYAFQLMHVYDCLPRDGPVTYNRYGSLVAEDDLPETQENL